MGLKDKKKSLKRRNILLAFLLIAAAISIIGICSNGYITYFKGGIALESLKTSEMKMKYVRTEVNFLLGPFAGYDYGMGESPDKAYVLPVKMEGTKITWIAVYVNGNKGIEAEKLMAGGRDTVVLKGTISPLTGELKKYYQEFTGGYNPSNPRGVFLPLILESGRIPLGIEGLTAEFPILIIAGVVSIGMLLGAMVLIIRSQRNDYQKYIKEYCENSSDYEYSWGKIDELCSSEPLIKGVWMNDKWLLFQIEKYFYILELDKIVWIYYEKAYHLFGLCIIGEDKKKYCIPIKEKDRWIIDYMVEKMENTLFGYCEEFQQLYNEDFEKFKREARKISV